MTVDDQPIAFDAGWSANTRANLGHDQFRGRVAGTKARQLAAIDQGSTLRCWAETMPYPFWEGRVSAPPKPEQDGTATVAAQGNGYAAAKFGGRLPIRVSDAAAWQDASAPPLNWPTTSATRTLEVNGIQSLILTTSGGSDTNAAVALWVPGTRFMGVTGSMVTDTTHTIRYFTATGPDIAATRFLEHIVPASFDGPLNVTFAHPQDCVVIEFRETGSAATHTMINNSIRPPAGVGEVNKFSSVYADLDPTYLARARQVAFFTGSTEDGGDDSWGWKVYSHDAIKGIGNKLGFDTSMIGQPGMTALTQFDWAGGAASALDDLASGDDLCWFVLHDRMLRLEPYDWRTYEVSARTGARWDLDPLELFNRAVAQLIDATTDSLANVALDADPDPLADAGITNELPITIANKQLSRDRANLATWRALQAGLATRYRGRITAARVFDSESGRECTYEALPGTVRIRDYSDDGESLSLRIGDVQFGPSAVVIGVEAPALPVGPLGGSSTGGFNVPNPTVQQTPTYLPPGAPGNPAPRFNPPGGIVTLPGPPPAP